MSVPIESDFIRDPSRLGALDELIAATAQSLGIFDQLAHEAAIALKTPIALVTFVGAEEQTFRGEHGLPATLAILRKMPVSYSICQYTIRETGPFLMADSDTHATLMNHPSVVEMGIRAYLGIPLVLQSGHSVAALSFVDYVPRSWSHAEIRTAQEFAARALALMSDALENHRRELGGFRIILDIENLSH